jgi:COP9 signalosome complex subunit 2
MAIADNVDWSLWNRIIREEGGKMYLEQGEWLLAYNELFASFRNHQEAGNVRAVQVLKYAVLANMLAGSAINPFDSREAKVYQDVAEIGAMLLLRSAYDTSDTTQFEKVLRGGGSSGSKLLRDPVMARYVDPLLRNLRCRVLKKLAKPYDVLTLASLASSLHISVGDVEQLAVALIQNEELDARIDQTRGLLMLSTDRQRRRQRYAAISICAVASC